jgi:hypothetical protein
MTRPDRRSRPLPSTRLLNADLIKLWSQLRDGTVAEAYKAKWTLVADPDATTAFLGGKFVAVKRVEPEKIRIWITDLDSPKFAARESAEKNLLTSFHQTEAELRQAHDKATGEARRRLGRILETELGAVPSPNVLREMRAVEVLDQIGTKAALDVVRELTLGKVHFRVAREAGATLSRTPAK